MKNSYFSIISTDRQRDLELNLHNPIARFCFDNIRSTDKDKTSQNEKKNLFGIRILGSYCYWIISTDTAVVVYRTISSNDESSQVQAINEIKSKWALIQIQLFFAPFQQLKLNVDVTTGGGEFVTYNYNLYSGFQECFQTTINESSYRRSLNHTLKR